MESWLGYPKYPLLPIYIQQNIKIITRTNHFSFWKKMYVNDNIYSLRFSRKLKSVLLVLWGCMIFSDTKNPVYLNIFRKIQWGIYYNSYFWSFYYLLNQNLTWLGLFLYYRVSVCINVYPSITLPLTPTWEVVT